MKTSDGKYILTDVSGLAIFVDEETYKKVMELEKIKELEEQNENE